jgi:acyl-CoA dehydrogenase
MEELKAKAKARGLWNLFLPEVSGLTNLEYAPLWYSLPKMDT